MDDPIDIDGTLRIPVDELTFTTSRSSGPGGQHVNKTASRVTLRFDVASSPSLDDDQRARIRERPGTRITKAGVLLVHAQAHRSQKRNRDTAAQRFADLLRSALSEQAARRPTRVPQRARRRRLENKRRRSQAKALRKAPPADDR